MIKGDRILIDNKKVAGIVCEYNPFHNGHKYHIQQTKEITGCEYIVCAMSGSMVQRGEVAVCDKWHRAATAVDNGADLVIEIPTCYVLQSADNYAYGAVSLLHSLGVVDCLSFGSECGDTDTLWKVADIISHEPEEYSDALKSALSRGNGYPAACAYALSRIMGKDFEFSPNDILAVNYIKAIHKLQSTIAPVAIHRTNNYHSTDADKAISSATAVRALIADGKDISSFVPDVPDTTYHTRNIESLILGFFRTAKPEQLENITGMEKGLANRLISCAGESSGYDSFIDACSTKRYTRHRIQRVVMSCILGLMGGCSMDYVRVLALSKKGCELLAQIKKTCPLTPVTKAADFVPGANSMFRYDILSTDIAALCCDNQSQRTASKDFTTSPYVQK